MVSRFRCNATLIMHTHTQTQIPVAMRLSQNMLTFNVREPNLGMPA